LYQIFNNSIYQKFSPYGRIRDFHLPRYQGIAVAYYGCTLECLTNDRLEFVKPPCLYRVSGIFCLRSAQSEPVLSFYSAFSFMAKGSAFWVPRLNSLRSFSTKNLTGQAGIGDQRSEIRSQRSEYQKVRKN